jgi:hypothetical protein
MAEVPVPDGDVTWAGTVVQKMAFLFDGREAGCLARCKNCIPEVVMSAGNLKMSQSFL